MKKFLILLSLFTLAITSSSGLLNPKKVQAGNQDISITWIDYNHLNFQQTRFPDSGTYENMQYSRLSNQNGVYTLAGIFQTTLFYTLTGSIKTANCSPTIEVNTEQTVNQFVPNQLPNSIKKVTITPVDSHSNGSLCKKIEINGKDVSNKNVGNSKILFNWVDQGTLQPVGGNLPYSWETEGLHARLKNYQSFAYDAQLKVFKESSSVPCPSYINNISSDKSSADFYIGNDKATGDCSDDFKKPPLRIGLNNKNENATKPAGTGVSTPTPGSSKEEPKLTCEFQFTDPLTWIACPIINGANAIINQLDTAISHELFVNTCQYLEETSTCDTTDSTSEGLSAKRQGPQFFKAWSVVRYISMGLIVIIMLVMVISQALSFGIFDAYSIRKIMPRLLFAVIFIAVSWSILKLMVNFSNDLGTAVRSIIYSPFSDINLKFGPGATSEGIFAVGAVGIGLTLGLLGVLSFALTALLSVFIAFILLVFRKMAILLLIIFSPIAIIASILPGTNKIWKKWWEYFMGALLVFPMITGFIAIGKVFAGIAGGDDPAKIGLFNQIIMFVSYYGPYMALPLIFKFAGGLLGNVAGMADKSRGVFDRLKKGRQNMVAKNAHDIKAGNRFKGQGWASRRASRALQTATLAPSGGLTLNNNKRRARMQTARSGNNFDLAQEYLNKDPGALAIKGDDDKMWAAAHGENESQVRGELLKRAPGRFSENDPVTLNQAVAEVMRFKRNAGDDVGRIASTIAQAGTGTGYNYRFDEHGNVTDDMYTAIIDAAGDDRSLAGRMVGAMRPLASQSGRVDLAGGGFAKSMQVIDKRRQAMANAERGLGEVIEVDDEEFVRDASGNVMFNAVSGKPQTRTRIDPATGMAMKTTKSYTVDDARLETLQDVLQSNAAAAVSGKVESVRQLAPVMKAEADKALQSGSQTWAIREIAKIAGKYDAAGQIAPQNAEALADGILAQRIDSTSLPANIQTLFSGLGTNFTYQQAIETLRNNPDFQTMRREYGSTAAAIAAGVTGQTPIPPPPQTKI